MLESLEDLFNSIELSWIDSIEDIDNSDEFNGLLLIFPNLQRIFQEAREKNKDAVRLHYPQDHMVVVRRCAADRICSDRRF